MSLQDDLDRVTPLFGMDWVISALKAVRIFNDGKADHQAWIDAAIHLLEAADRCDKQTCLEWFDDHNSPLEGPPQIRALLSALPDAKE